jgi:hypothetical protein
MTAERRQWLIGGGVVAALAVAVWLQFSAKAPAATAATAAAPARAARATTQRQAAAAEPVRPVRLRALEQDRDEPSDGQRNPFRFKPKVVAPPPRAVAPPPPTTPMMPVPAGPVTPPGPPPPPPIALKFIGLVNKADGVKIAVLSDSKVTLYGREGDIIDGRYRIVKIGVESIELTYADGRGHQTIRLTGQ